MLKTAKYFFMIASATMILFSTSASAQWYGGYGNGYYYGYAPTPYPYGGYYGGGYNRWDGRDWHGGRWGHDDDERGGWDGHDWHGGRWGHDD